MNDVNRDFIVVQTVVDLHDAAQRLAEHGAISIVDYATLKDVARRVAEGHDRGTRHSWLTEDCQ